MRFIVLIVCFFFTSPAWAKCTLREFIRSAIVPAESRMGTNEIITKINSPYQDFHFKVRARKVAVYQDSLAEKAPYLVTRLDEMDRFTIGIGDFTNQFKKLYERNPTSAETREFFFSRIRIFDYQTRKIRTVVEQVAPHHVETINKNFSTTLKETYDLLNQIHPHTSLDKTELLTAKIGKKISGFSGELRGLVSLPRVTRYSQNIRNISMIRDAAEETFQSMRMLARNSPEQFLKIKNKYPNIFGHRFYKFKNDDLALIDEAERWVSSKEADFLREDKGVIHWMEFKVNATPFTKENFQADQISQYSEIIRFLDLENKVHLEYFATGGVSPEVRRYLESQHVRIIDPTPTN